MATTTSQGEPGSDGNEGLHRIPRKLQHPWNLTIRLFIVISRDTRSEWGSYPAAEMQPVYSTATAYCEIYHQY